MKTESLKSGSVIEYTDGRKGHCGIKATVLETDKRGMLVQFVDRADTTRIAFNQKAWMDNLSIVHIAMAVRHGLFQVQDVRYDDKGVSTITPLTGWIDFEMAKAKMAELSKVCAS